MAVEVALVLPRRVAVRILGAAQSAQPGRLAGLVGADLEGPAAFFPLRNVAAQPESAILYSTDELAQANTALRQRGLNLWAYVTSHPTQSAEPAVQDFMTCPFPNEVQLVVSLSTKGVLEMRAWQLRGGVPRERVLKIRD
jgi:[CysO sulfur-carrier protein]-S-L-cysteine hydrolase